MAATADPDRGSMDGEAQRRVRVNANHPNRWWIVPRNPKTLVRLIESRMGFCAPLAAVPRAFLPATVTGSRTLIGVVSRAEAPSREEPNSVFAASRLRVSYHPAPPLRVPGVLPDRAPIGAWVGGYWPISRTCPL